MLGRAQGEARLGQVDILAHETESAAEFPRPARLGDQLVAPHAGREFALDDLDRRDARFALVGEGARQAVHAGPSAGAAAEELVLHIALARAGRAAADDDRTAGRTIAAPP